MDMDEARFTGGMAAVSADIRSKDLSNWIERGLVRASGGPAGGSGHPRRYSGHDILRIAIAYRISQTGLPLTTIAGILAQLEAGRGPVGVIMENVTAGRNMWLLIKNAGRLDVPGGGYVPEVLDLDLVAEQIPLQEIFSDGMLVIDLGFIGDVLERIEHFERKIEGTVSAVRECGTDQGADLASHA